MVGQLKRTKYNQQLYSIPNSTSNVGTIATTYWDITNTHDKLSIYDKKIICNY